MMDYMLPKRVMSWREAWNIYGVENGNALFRDLARYGIKPPMHWDDVEKSIDHTSHQIMLGLYQWKFGTAFHSWTPTASDIEWLKDKYPTTFEKYYLPRWEYAIAQKENGGEYNNFGLPKLCQTCQLPCLFTEPDDQTQLAHRETEYEGEKYHFCSDGCQHVFEQEPEKYVQAWLPMPALMQEPLKGDLAAWMEWVSLEPTAAGEYANSEDK